MDLATLTLRLAAVLTTRARDRLALGARTHAGSLLTACAAPALAVPTICAGALTLGLVTDCTAARAGVLRLLAVLAAGTFLQEAEATLAAGALNTG